MPRGPRRVSLDKCRISERFDPATEELAKEYARSSTPRENDKRSKKDGEEEEEEEDEAEVSRAEKEGAKRELVW